MVDARADAASALQEKLKDAEGAQLEDVDPKLLLSAIKARKPKAEAKPAA